MTHDDFSLSLSRRKTLAALGSIGVASAGAGLGTSAYFSDQETFENNALTAGTLDMKIAWDEHYSDWMDGEAAVAEMPDGETPTFRLPPGPAADGEAIELVVDDGPGFLNATRQEQANGGLYGGATDLCADADADADADATGQPLIDLADVKPGDFGFGLFRVQLCANPGKLWLTGGLEAAAESGQTEPEADDPDEYGDAGATNPALVELLDVIQVAFGVGSTRNLAASHSVLAPGVPDTLGKRRRHPARGRHRRRNGRRRRSPLLLGWHRRVRRGPLRLCRLVAPHRPRQPGAKRRGGVRPWLLHRAVPSQRDGRRLRRVG